jgi:hypothetical protein
MPRNIYRMSEIGHCATRITAIRLGKLPQKFSQIMEDSADEGNWHEERIMNKLTNGELPLPKFGKVKAIIHDRQQEQKLEDAGWILLGHIDGRATLPNGIGLVETGIEVKSMSQYQYDRWIRGKFGEFPEYAQQLSCYMTITKLPFFYLVKNRNYGNLDISFIQIPPVDIKDTVYKINCIDNAIADGKLFHWKEFDENDIECSRCRFSYCLSDEISVDVDAKENLSLAVKTYLEKARVIKEAKAEQDKVTIMLKAHFEQNGTKSLKIEGATVTRVKYLKPAYTVSETEMDYIMVRTSKEAQNDVALS